MSLPNGLTSANQCFRNGSRDTNIFVRKGDQIVDPVFGGQITVTDSSGDSGTFDPSFLELNKDAVTARFELVTSGRVTMSAENSFLIVPNSASGAPTDGIVFQDGSATSMLIAPSSVGIQLVSQSVPGFNTISLSNPGSGLGMGAANTGVINFIQVVASGSYSIQFQGSNCIPGTIWDFFVVGNSLVGPQSVVFENGSTAIITVTTGPNTIPAGTARPIRIFTPDGTTFLLIA